MTILICTNIFYLIHVNYFSSFGKEEYFYSPSHSKDHKSEINLIYIGSSRCVFSNSEILYRTVDSIKSKLRNLSTLHGIGFSSIGIAADWNPMVGINHLKNFGNFDEIISGNFWYNNGIIKYVGERGNEASTPQIILTFRTYTEQIKFDIVEEKKILSLNGEYQIVEWFNKGAQLPDKFIQELQEITEIN